MLEDSLGAGEPTKGVRVAILNSGIDMSNPYLRKVKSRIKKTKSWVDGPGHEDEVGFGTHAAALILRIAPAAEIFSARISRHRPLGIDSDHVIQVGHVQLCYRAEDLHSVRPSNGVLTMKSI